MECLQRILDRIRRVVQWRVVADEDHLDALQTHDAVRLWPAPVVAQRDAHDTAECPPHAEALGGLLEIAPLEMLERALGLVLFVPRNVHLAVFGEEGALPIDEDGGVEAVPVRGEFGVPQVEADAEALGFVEERLRLCGGHLGLEVREQLG